MNFLPCTSTADGASTSYDRNIKEGDLVIVYEGHDAMKAVTVTANGRFENRFGIFAHKSWIGKPFGSKVTAGQGARGWVYLLRPTPELWTQVLRHRTQILYLADISMVCMQLELRPGCVVLESGTGSGSLTHSLVRAVAPTGHVHTFEFHAGRAEDAAAEFKEHGLTELVTVAQRNIEEQGFPDTLHGRADAVFLDLPGPHKVVASAAKCLKPNGRFCSFSPCIEQVQKTCEQLSAQGFTDVITYECLLRDYEVHQEYMQTSVPLALSAPPPKRQRVDTPKDKAAKAESAPSQPVQAEAAAPASTEAGGKEDASKEQAPAGEGAAGEGRQAVQGDAEAEAAAGGTDAEMATGEGQAAGAETEGGEGTAAAAEGPKADAGEAAAAARAGAGGSQEGQGQAGAHQQGQKRQQAVAPSTVRIVSCRPSVEARGHTGYLTFARLFVTGAEA